MLFYFLLAFIWYLVYEFIFKIAVAEKILNSEKNFTRRSFQIIEMVFSTKRINRDFNFIQNDTELMGYA